MRDSRARDGGRRRPRAYLLGIIGVLAGLLVAVPGSPGASADIQNTPINGQQGVLNAPQQVAAGQVAAPGATAPAPPANFETDRPTAPEDSSAPQANAAEDTAKPAAPTEPVQGAPLAIGPINFVGDEQGGPGGGWVPPDTDGAVGNNQYTEVTNADVRAWNLGSSPPGQLFHRSLTGHLGNNAAAYFDPITLYHPIYNRWIVMAPQFPSSGGAVQNVSFSVSRSPNIAGAYCVYTIDTTNLYSDGSFFDYPHIGFDHDALIITANIFDPGFVGASAIFFPWAEITSCLGTPFWFFSGLNGTLQPPRVYDNNPRSILLAHQGTFIREYTARDTGRIPVELFNTGSFDVADVSGPPDADQNSSIDKVDALDGRFVNASYQHGDLIYQAHSHVCGSFACARWYKLNHATNAVVKQCSFFSSGLSDDFNVSIAANPSGDVFLNWSATRVTGAAQIHARAGGAENTDLTTTCPALTQLTYGVGHEYGNGNGTVETLRWGDYSSVYLKFNTNRALVVNELAGTSGGSGVSTVWGSKIAEVRFG